jgi:hypothetical protein
MYSVRLWPGLRRFGATQCWTCRFEEGNHGLEDEIRPSRLRPTERDDSIFYSGHVIHMYHIDRVLIF